MEAATRKNRWTLAWFILALISSWTSFIFVITAGFGIAFWLLALVILFIRKSKLKWFLLALSAWMVIPAFSFITGVKDYFNGEATFKFYGYPDPEFYNLNAEYRVWTSSSGCVVYGFEPLTHFPNNEAIVLCTKLFGFQKGVYTGIYPSKEETDSLLITAVKVSFTTSPFVYHFSFNNREYELHAAEAQSGLDSAGSAHVSVLNNELIIFRPFTGKDEVITYLADSKTGEVFAKYYTQTEHPVISTEEKIHSGINDSTLIERLDARKNN